VKNVNQKRKYSNGDLMDKLIGIVEREIAAYTEAEKQAKEYIIELRQSRKRIEKTYTAALKARKTNAAQ
jgi:hypothetical protein